MVMRIPDINCGLKSIAITTVYGHILFHTAEVTYWGAHTADELEELPDAVKQEFCGNSRMLNAITEYNCWLKQSKLQAPNVKTLEG